MEWEKFEIRVPKEMLAFLLTENTSDELRRNALILYPYINDLTISHGRAAEILGIPKWDLIELYEDIGLPYLDMDISEVEKELGVELILDEADQASKETDVRYHHKEVFSKVRRSISENDSVTVAQKECSGRESEEMLLFQELDKGINDMEADRVIEHDEAMRTFKGKIK